MTCALGCQRSADVGLLCYRDHDRLADMLDPRNVGSASDPERPDDLRVVPSIPVLYAGLWIQRRGSGLAPVGPPAFGPSSPGDDTVIVLRDHRSRPDIIGPDDVERAPRPPLMVLAAVANRLGPGMSLRQRSVGGLSSWLHGAVRALAEQSWVPDAYRDLRAVSGALRAAIGDPQPSSIGTCRVIVDNEGREDPAGAWRCAVPLFLPELPPRAPDEPMLPPALYCPSCGHRYTGAELVEIAKNPLAAA